MSVATAAPAGLYFIHTDHLNTSRLITNNVGQTAWTWANDDPFGNNAPNDNPSGLGTFTCNLRLPGQYFDKETNLHYNGARDYDPAIGRYIQSDPIGLAAGLNTYGYVGGNPLRYSDPTGLDVWILGKTAVDPGVGGGTDPVSYHLYLQLVPNDPAAFSDRTGWTSLPNGQISATLGGQSGGLTAFGFPPPFGTLRGTPNYPPDDPAKAAFRQKVDPPCGLTDTQFINLLIQASGSYRNNLLYFPFPIPGYFNSNGLIAGFLQAAGVVPPPLNTLGAFQAPGYNKPVPLPRLYSPTCCQ